MVRGRGVRTSSQSEMPWLAKRSRTQLTQRSGVTQKRRIYVGRQAKQGGYLVTAAR